MSTNSNTSLPTIELGLMPQQAGVSNELDWTGVTDPSQRRKLQNCLNQRALRIRRKKEDQSSAAGHTARSNRRITPVWSKKEGSAISPSTDKEENHTTPVLYCINSHPRVTKAISQFVRLAHQHYQQGTPVLAHLPLLLQFNVNAAFEHNAEIMGLMNDHHDWYAISPFNKKGPCLGQHWHQLSSAEWPVSLYPTSLQVTIEHHPWIDFFPFPQLRDNLLLAVQSEVCDEDELCRDLCQYDGDTERKSNIIVWGKGSDPSNWEASLVFVEKWGYLLSGCVDLFHSTNYWRAKRGEQKISWSFFSAAVARSCPTAFRYGEG